MTAHVSLYARACEAQRFNATFQCNVSLLPPVGNRCPVSTGGLVGRTSGAVQREASSGDTEGLAGGAQ